MKQNNNAPNPNGWRGLQNVYMIWHGQWSDPELEAEGRIANYWDIENMFWAYFLQDHPEYKDSDSGNSACEEAFSAYLQENEEEVIAQIKFCRNNIPDTLGEFLEYCRDIKRGTHITVDGVNKKVAYCGTELTEAGYARFGDTLDLPMTHVNGHYVTSNDDEDYDLAENGKGKLQLAWDMLHGMANNCPESESNKYFID